MCFNYFRHLGNILIRPTKIKMIRFDGTNQIASEGFIVSIIDFSLARLQTGKKLHYRDLSADEWLFNGDASRSGQYEVYRKMRDLVKDNWAEFYPRTNLFWLEYIAKTLFDRLSVSKQKSKIGRELSHFLEIGCGQYESCQDLLCKDVLYRSWIKTRLIHKIKIWRR